VTSLAKKNYGDIIKRIVNRSFGQIERCVIASENGLPLATYGNPDEINEIIAAIAAPLFAATQDVINNLEKTRVVKIDVEFTNSKHLIIAPLFNDVIAVLSSRNPNLGLIYYLIEEIAEPKPEENRSSSKTSKKSETDHDTSL